MFIFVFYVYFLILFFTCLNFYIKISGLLRIQKVLALMTTQFPVVVRKLDPDGDNYNVIYYATIYKRKKISAFLQSVLFSINFQVLKDLLAYQQSRFLLDCHVDRIKKYMEIAEELDMLNHYQVIFVFY